MQKFIFLKISSSYVVGQTDIEGKITSIKKKAWFASLLIRQMMGSDRSPRSLNRLAGAADDYKSMPWLLYQHNSECVD